jgi:MFS family permease
MTDKGGTSEPERFPLWVLALSTTLGMQINASLLDQSLAIVAPLLTADLGLAPERIGNLSSLSALGTVLFLLFGPPILVRLGPVRMLQIGALTAVSGLLLATSGYWPLILCAALMMGLGYGPTPPAGSRILAATAPARHRTLIFSVKQAGAPVGGAIAALLLAPVAGAYGWQAAIGVSVAIALVAAAVIELTGKRLDVERRGDQRIDIRTVFAPRAVAEPILALIKNRGLLSVSGLAFSFAIVQGSLFSFSVTYLVSDRGLSLAQAGLAYASMQGAGSVARIMLGWLADWTGRPALNLAIQAIVAAGLVMLYGQLPFAGPLWVFILASGSVGFFAASWNGIFMAEVARLSPPNRVAEATSSAVLVAFLGYVSGPTLYSLLVTWTGEYAVAFAVVGAQLLAASFLQLANVRGALGSRPPA